MPAHTQTHTHNILPDTLTCGTHTHRHTHMWHTLTHSLSHCQKCLAECLDARRDSIQVDLTCLQRVADARRPQLACCLPACQLAPYVLPELPACLPALPACTVLLCVHFRFLTPPYTLQQQLHLQLPPPPAGCCAIFNKLSVISRVQPQRRHLCQCSAEQGTRGRTDQCQSLCP